MNDAEKVQSFAEMTEASRKITRPWIIFCCFLLAALVATNALWAYVHYKQIKFAYMTPEEVSQTQDFEAQHQNQSYSAGPEATQGK